jgi:hypothetical protein
MKSINQMVLLSVIIALIAGLICSPVAVTPVMAEPRDPCFGGGGCEGSICSTFDDPGYMSCCWLGPNGENRICQTCKIDYETGEFIFCSTPHSEGKGGLGSSVVAPPPSGKAPPPSTEKCPDNSAVDSKGNCTPITQSPNDGDNKPKFPRGDILGELQSNSELPPQS